MRKWLSVCISCICVFQLTAQSDVQIQRAFGKDDEQKPGWQFAIAPQSASCIALDWPRYLAQDVTVRLGNTSVLCRPEPHFEDENITRSSLQFLKIQKGDTLLIVAPGISLDNIPISVIFLSIPQLAAPLRTVESRAACDSPAVISQSVWRTGLTPPVVGRSATPTQHCIVHHSAGGNGDTNYIQLVRSYYVFHTQVNGWDDIGYNYLIAANGQIFAGRDPEKPEIRQDNVLGAHFCSKNQYTMGVCMMGDFSLQGPTEAALSALQHLLAWKIHKDSLNPLGSMPHPNNNSSLLPVVAGHRDGCATACPGDSLYVQLETLRQQLVVCSVVADVSAPVREIPTRIQRIGAELHVQGANHVEVYDMAGRRLCEAHGNGQDIVLAVPDGVLCVRTSALSGILQQRIIL